MLMSIENSIICGLDFLRRNQMLHGEFKTYISTDMNMREQYKYISTTYITSYILYAISFIHNKLVEDIKSKALNFLLEEMEGQGAWRFFTTNRNIKLVKGQFIQYTQMGIVPDIDDTACIAFCMKQNDIDIPDNINVFLNNRNDKGLFYTWLLNIARRKEYSESTIYMDINENDVCSGVNANVLLYLGENEYTKPICHYLNYLILNDRIDSSYVYFPNSLIIYYLTSRAFFNGATNLDESISKVIENLKRLQAEDGSIISPLNTAYAVCTALNYGIMDDFLVSSITYLLNTQNRDGSWDKERFCDGGIYYYGSEELTTALCLEAICRYEITIKAVQV